MEDRPELTVAGNDRLALERELVELAGALLKKGAITSEAFDKLVELQVRPQPPPEPALKLVPEDA